MDLEKVNIHIQKNEVKPLHCLTQCAIENGQKFQM